MGGTAGALCSLATGDPWGHYMAFVPHEDEETCNCRTQQGPGTPSFWLASPNTVSPQTVRCDVSHMGHNQDWTGHKKDGKGYDWSALGHNGDNKGHVRDMRRRCGDMGHLSLPLKHGNDSTGMAGVQRGYLGTQQGHFGVWWGCGDVMGPSWAAVGTL